ncbi:MAG: DUF1648 domain-containing protein [Deltaproteobacteria bacterium]
MHANDFIPLMVVMISTVILSGFLLYKLPGLTRPDIFFSVTIQPDFRESESAQAIVARYRREIVLHSLIGIALIVLVVLLRIPGALVVGLLWQVFGFFIAFLRARAKVMPQAAEPSAVREADLAPARTRLPGGWLGQMGPFAILIVTGVWLRLHWDEIPDKFTVHWGFDGRPNGWASHTPVGVYGPLLMGMAVCAGLCLMNYAIAAFSRRVHVRGAAAGFELRFRHIMLSIMLGVEYFVALLISWVGLLALRSAQAGPNAGPVLLGTFALSAIVTYVIIRTGQGGTRLAGSGQSFFDSGGEVSPTGDRTPDRFWKAGMFYVNPDDPAIMVEARFGVGYTLNFGRPLSWVILVLVIATPLVVVLLARHVQ